MFGWDDALSAGLGIYSAFSSAKAGKDSSNAISAMNAQNAAEAQKNRDFQERMSNTAHTREVADLRNAGLNPILSATGGSGASSPGGSMAVMQNTEQQSAPIKAQLANLAASTAKMIAETQTERSRKDLTDAQTDAAGGSLNTPFGNMPWSRVARLLGSGINSAKSALTNVTKPSGNRQQTLKSQGVKTWFN